ncbi:hypothetical protein [Pontibacter cellulosilyticus]|uniref:Uncharacterized protein n=1 Tax=Pontibacter cellulosilyticus TaxID=1720253 RepID=A0A923SKB2_9BACT|nr:hypothetical protein [Pontibacter cellulosilyticus]MBC5994688.1 hypothetical protein [Pontibacter cellulosilyticus]
MRALKATLGFLILVYVIFTALLLTAILNEHTIFNIRTEEQILTMYKALVAIGGVLMLARLLVTRLYIADMKYDRHMAQLKINELKADLYEKRQAFRSNSYKERASEPEVEYLKQA